MLSLLGLFIIFSTFISAANSQQTVKGQLLGISNGVDRIKGGYWPSYAPTLVPPESIDTTLFTHVFYAFAGMNQTTFAVIPNENDAIFSNFSAILRKKNPSIKTLISIGGATANPKNFSTMAAGETLRETFIKSSIDLARKNSFDGLDLDWEYPGNEQDMANLGTLFSEWRSAVNKDAAQSGLPTLLLTAAVYYNASTSETGSRYPVASLAENADWLNIMSFDYHGRWENVTGEHSALYDDGSPYNTDYGVKNWLQQGLPKHKAVLGIPMYGKSWTLQSASNATVGAIAKGPGPSQSLSQEAGIFFYREVREFVVRKNATDRIHSRLMSAYCYHDNVWIGYENPRTVRERVKYLMKNEMRGYFFWSFAYDSNWRLSKSASVTMNHLPLRNGTDEQRQSVVATPAWAPDQRNI